MKERNEEFMKQYGKAIVFAVCMLFGVLLTGMNSMAADSKKIVKKNTDFTVEVEMGINQFAAYGRPMPIRVKVESKQNFEGEVQVYPATSDNSSKIALAQDVTIAAGESRKLNFAIANAGYYGEYYIQILDNRGKVVYKEKDTKELDNLDTNMMVGILSDDFTALNYMDGLEVRIGNGNNIIKILELSTEEMPESSTILSVLSYIVIDNYDTAQLSDAQYSALKEWVNNGGVLILGMGNNYQNVLHCFQDDFLTGTFHSVEKKTLTWVDTGEELTLENVDCVNYSLEGGEQLTGFSTDGTVCYKNSGKGRVVMLAYDLGMEPFVSNAANTSLATTLFRTTQTTATVDTANGSYYDGSAYEGYQIAKLADDSEKPSGLLYGVILFIYVILVGPVLYLVLKAVGQREKIWIAVPAAALVFTGVIYLTSSLYRVRYPIVDTLSVISLEQEHQSERIYTNVTCPRAKDYTIRLNAKYKDIWYDSDSYSYTVFGTESAKQDEYTYLIKDTADGKQITFHNQQAFRNNAFTSMASGKNEIGEITYDLDCTTGGFSGTVTNQTNYDLEGVIVTFENHIYIAGDMKAGETIEIDSSKLKNTTGYGTFSQLYPSGTKNRKAYRYNQIDSMMENYYMRVSEYGRGIIWAKIDGYQQDYVQADNVKKYGVGVVYTTYQADYTDVKGVYYQSIDPMSTQIDNGNYGSDDRVMYSDSVDVTYDFTDYPGITRLQVLSKKDDLSYGVYAKVYAYNPKTDNYEEIFQDKDIIAGEQLQKYIDNNVLRLRYENDDSQGEQGLVPRICARGNE